MFWISNLKFKLISQKKVILLELQGRFEGRNKQLHIYFFYFIAPCVYFRRNVR